MGLAESIDWTGEEERRAMCAINLECPDCEGLHFADRRAFTSHRVDCHGWPATLLEDSRWLP